MSSRRFLSLTFIAFLTFSAISSQAQTWPTAHPIRIFAAAAGGGTDTIARLLITGLGPALGQSIIVENRGGHGSIPGAETAKAAPDGYTFVIHTGNLWISAMMMEKSPYDP